MLYPGDGLPEVYPKVRRGLDAGDPDPQQGPHLSDGGRPGGGEHVRVEKLRLPVAGGGEGPVDDVGAALAVGVVLRGELPGENLEQDEAEAEDVGLAGDCPAVGGAVGEHGFGGAGGAHEWAQRVVAEEGLVVVGQEDVAGLEVPVWELEARELRVEEPEPAGHAFRDLQTGLPVQLRVDASPVS